MSKVNSVAKVADAVRLAHSAAAQNPASRFKHEQRKMPSLPYRRDERLIKNKPGSGEGQIGLGFM